MARSHSNTFAAPARVSSALLSRLGKGILILAGVSLAVLVGLGGFLNFRILTARNDVENVTPSSYLLTNYVNKDFTDSHGGIHSGWMFYGLRGAPAIILCPGYDSNRSELLFLATALQQNHFNVYVFNFAGTQTGELYTNLGAREASVVSAAIRMVTKQKGVNPLRVGLFGVTTGAFGAIAAAEDNPLVSALVVDGAYENPVQMFDAQLDLLLGRPGPLFRILSETEFRLLTLTAKAPSVAQNLPKLDGRPKLFISASDRPLLAAATEDLYRLSSQPKRLLVMDRTQTTSASNVDRKEYEDQILNFFIQNLPLRAN